MLRVSAADVRRHALIRSRVGAIQILNPKRSVLHNANLRQHFGHFRPISKPFDFRRRSAARIARQPRDGVENGRHVVDRRRRRFNDGRHDHVERHRRSRRVDAIRRDARVRAGVGRTNVGDRETRSAVRDGVSRIERKRRAVLEPGNRRRRIRRDGAMETNVAGNRYRLSTRMADNRRAVCKRGKIFFIIIIRILISLYNERRWRCFCESGLLR